MLRLLCTTTVSRLRELPIPFVPTTLVPLLFALGQLLPERLVPAYAGVASVMLPRRPASPRRFIRQMAVPLPEPLLRPMAVPFESPEPSRASMLVAAAALAFAIAGLWRQDSVLRFTHVALDGLRAQEVGVMSVDQADVPAMEPSLAWVMDPRPKLGLLPPPRAARPAIKPFEYEVREGETLDDIARRFGTDVDALLWNNGLDTADQVEAGDRLMVLPVRGVLHLVKLGDTLNSIAERYGANPDDLAIANALDDPNTIVPEQVLVVAGGRVPLAQVAQANPAAGPASQIVAIIGLAPAAAPEPTGEVLGPPVPAPDADLPSPPNANRWQREFILQVAPGARQSQRDSGVPASVTLAQAILESDWGRSKLSAEANNLFGIKALREPGTAGIYNIKTWEVSGGQDIMVMAGFKAYTSVADSIVDHGRWFHDNSRYHRALKVKDDPRAFAQAIADAGYATDPAYPAKLIGLMDKFNLYAYDLTPDGQ